MIKDYFNLAFLSVRKRKLRSYLTMIGIFIGIAAVVSLISLGQGLQVAIEEQFQAIGTDKIFVTPGAGFGPPGSAEIKLEERDKDIIEGVRGVKDAGALTFTFADITFEDHTDFIPVNGLPSDPEELKTVLEALSIGAEQGRDLKGGDKFKAVVGARHVREDTIWPKPVQLRDTISIEGQDFKVVGIMKEIGNPPDDSHVYIPEDAAREVFGLDDDEFDFIIVRTERGFEPAQIALAIEEEMRDDRGLEEGEEDFQVQTFESALETFSNIFGIVQAVLIGIAAISLLVGGIGIMNTMFMSVLERTKEVGVMKAIGARNSHILLLFLIESGLYGLVGGAIGVLIGVGLGEGTQYLATISLGTELVRAEFSTTLILGTLAFAFLLGMLSGIAPAYRASKLNPVDALRYE